MSRSQLSVLYVEDEAMDAELLVMNVERYNLSSSLALDVVNSVAGAKTKIDSKTYDAAMIDWNLADGRGLDIAEHIRQSNTKLPILFLSGVFTPDRREDALQYAPAACLEKDYSKEHVESIVRLLGDMLG